MYSSVNKCSQRRIDHPTLTPISLYDLSSAFIVFAIGISLSVLAFLVVKFFAMWKFHTRQVIEVWNGIVLEQVHHHYSHASLYVQHETTWHETQEIRCRTVTISVRTLTDFNLWHAPLPTTSRIKGLDVCRPELGHHVVVFSSMYHNFTNSLIQRIVARLRCCALERYLITL